MVDQTVKISNLPDCGSSERVAFDLMKFIRDHDESANYRSKQAILDLYLSCLKATWGQRPD